MINLLSAISRLIRMVRSFIRSSWTGSGPSSKRAEGNDAGFGAFDDHELHPGKEIHAGVHGVVDGSRPGGAPASPTALRRRGLPVAELAARNREGGYWIAATDPTAADHA